MKTFSSSKALLTIIAILTLVSCSTNQNQSDSVENKGNAIPSSPDMDHNSRNSLDWYGVYKGTTPCADCEGIETTITLKKDGTFKRSLKYLGKDENQFFDEGNFEWNEEGSKVTLKGEKGMSQMYQVGENALFHLDNEGNRITGDLAPNYRLEKNKTDPQLEGKRWVLIELRGKSFEKSEDMKEAFLMFEMETSTFSGNTSCNNIFGSYELKEGNKLSFGKAGATMMACPDMEAEKIFLDVLMQVDNYSILDGFLSLNKSKMAPLARFKKAEE